MSVVVYLNGRTVVLKLYVDDDGDAVVAVTEVDGEPVEDGNILAFQDDGIAMQYSVADEVPLPKNSDGEVVTY